MSDDKPISFNNSKGFDDDGGFSRPAASELAAPTGWAIVGKRWDVEREQMIVFRVPATFPEKHQAVRQLALINTIPTEWTWEIIDSPNDPSSPTGGVK